MFNLRPNLAKSLFALSILVFLLWLGYSAHSRSGRKARLAKALETGLIGKLSPEQTESLTSQIKWLAVAAGIQDDISLNRPLSAGKLNVYTTTPEAFDVTYCAQGNAIYDAELDAVFIDLSFLQPDEFAAILQASPYGATSTLSELPFFETYLRFILLHELGHRQLHRKGGGLFDRSYRSDTAVERRRESEADQFAIDHLQTAYSMDMAGGGTLIGKGGADILGLDSVDITPRDRVWIDLVAMVVTMNMYSQFLSTAYAPFYQDAAHPTFLTRARGLINQSLKDPDLTPQIRVHLEFFDRFLARQMETLQSGMVEVIFPEPVSEVNFDAQGLIATSIEMKSVFRVPYTAIKAESSTAAPRSIRATIATSSSGNGFNDAKSIIWSDNASGTWLFRDDQEAFVTRGGYWKPVENSISETLKDHYFPHEALPPQPSDIAVFLATRMADSKDWLYSFRRDELLAGKALSEILGQLPGAGTGSDRRLELNTVTTDKIFLTASRQTGDNREVTVAAVAVSDLNVLLSTKLMMPEEAPSHDSVVQLVVVPDAGSERYMLIVDTDKDGRHGWTAWELFTQSSPQIISSQSYLLDQLGDNAGALRRVIDPQLFSARWLPPHGVMITCNSDSIYTVDLETKQTRVIFHPGDELLRSRIGAQGLVTIFLKGGRKCYVVRTE